jgi:hypothetical protein
MAHPERSAVGLELPGYKLWNDYHAGCLSTWRCRLSRQDQPAVQRVCRSPEAKGRRDGLLLSQWPIEGTEGVSLYGDGRFEAPACPQVGGSSARQASVGIGAGGRRAFWCCAFAGVPIPLGCRGSRCGDPGHVAGGIPSLEGAADYGDKDSPRSASPTLGSGRAGRTPGNRRRPNDAVCS